MKIIVFFLLFVTFYSCDKKNTKELVLESKSQKIKLVLIDYESSNINLIQTILLKDFSYFKLRDSLENVLYSCNIKIFKDIESYKNMEDYYGDFYDPKIPNDSLKYNYTGGEWKLVEINKTRINNSDFRILNLEYKNDLIKTVCVISMDKMIIYIMIYGSSKKNINTIKKNNNLLKGMKVIKLD